MLSECAEVWGRALELTDLSWAVPLKTLALPFSSYQLPAAPQLGVGTPAPPCRQLTAAVN